MLREIVKNPRATFQTLQVSALWTDEPKSDTFDHNAQSITGCQTQWRFDSEKLSFHMTLYPETWRPIAYCPKNSMHAKQKSKKKSSKQKKGTEFIVMH